MKNLTNYILQNIFNSRKRTIMAYCYANSCMCICCCCWSLNTFYFFYFRKMFVFSKDLTTLLWLWI